MLVRKKDILSFYDKVKKLAVSSLEKERYEDAVVLYFNKKGGKTSLII